MSQSGSGATAGPGNSGGLRSGRKVGGLAAAAPGRLPKLSAAVLGLCCAWACAQTVFPPTARPALPLGAPTPAPVYRQISWDSLSPPGWNAMQGVAGVDLKKLDDADPAAAAMLKKLRAAWDQAPVNMQMVGQAVRLAGYVVPLEQNASGMTEFLLVPYHGACIHTPPPPSNQIVHVLPRSAARDIKSMDTVMISGVLRYARNESYMGASSWRVEAVAVEPYADPRPGVVNR